MLFAFEPGLHDHGDLAEVSYNAAISAAASASLWTLAIHLLNGLCEDPAKDPLSLLLSITRRSKEHSVNYLVSAPRV